jgi:Tfp pilus assembly protein PilO
MAGNDRTIILVVPVIAALFAFWFLALSPKQDEVKKLDSQISKLQSDVAQQEQAAQAGQQARKDFPRDYQRLVVMGKAVPVDDETASLLVQINRIAERTGVSFRAIQQSAGTATATAAPVTPTAPPTETTASLLPIGASVGSAGLPTLPYELIFRGNYFEVADFMAGIDNLVKPRKGTISADGRLVTIDGFVLASDESAPLPVVKATMSVTTYVTPADQGLTAGASPTGPSPGVTSVAQQTTPTASTTP